MAHHTADQQYKIVLLGEGRVGKTCLVLRYCKNSFSESQASTLQASFLQRKFNVDGERLVLNVWDTAGQERFHALGPIYYRDADGAVLVYDITDAASFDKVKNWVKELRKIVGQNVQLVIAGNKSDLERSRQVPLEDALAYAASVNATHHMTSAKLGRGVDEMFLDLSKRVMAKRKSMPSQTAGGARRRAGITVVNEAPAASTNEGDKKKGGCC